MDKVKDELDLSSYSSKIELDDATAVDTSNLAAKRVFLQRIKKVVNVIWIIFLTILDNLKAKVDDLDNDKLKIAPADL